MPQETLKVYHAMFTDAWRLLRKWMEECDGTDAFFEKAAKEASEFSENHKQCEWLASQIAMDTITEVGRISATIERSKA